MVTLSDEIALVLARSDRAAPIPSFACARATSPTERAICGDPDLAAWDRSVAAAYKQAAADGGGADDQKRWILERKRCGADKACLEKSLRERTDALMQGS